MAQTVRVTGLREAVRALEKYGADAEDLKAAFAEITKLVQTKADRRVQRDTGALAATIRPSKTKNKAVVRAGGARVPYAPRAHWSADQGTRFLSEPADETVPEALRLIEKELSEIAHDLGL